MDTPRLIVPHQHLVPVQREQGVRREVKSGR
jgi:hypothetical protein